MSVNSRGGDDLGLVKKKHIDQHGVRGWGKGDDFRVKYCVDK